MHQAIAYADERRLVEHQDSARAQLATLLVVRGDLDHIDPNALGRNNNATFIGPVALSYRLLIDARFDEAIAALPAPEMGFGIPLYHAYIQMARTRTLSLAGRHSAAQEEFQHWREALDAIGPLDNLGGFGMFMLHGASSITAFADQQFIQDVYQQLCTAPYSDYRMGSDERGPPAPRGDLAIHLGRIDEAESHYLRGVELSEREQLPFALGAAHQGLAEVAERRSDLDTARTHLDAAGELFAQHGAKLYLDQVIAKKEILKA